MSEIEGVLAAHRGVRTGGAAPSCICGEVYPHGPIGIPTPREWHEAHVAAEVRAWLLAPERVTKGADAAGERQICEHELRWQRDHDLVLTCLPCAYIAALTAVLGGGGDE